MAKRYKCQNPKIIKFNNSVIRSKTPAAKRTLRARKKGTIKGVVSKINKR